MIAALGDVLVRTYHEWRDDRCVRLGAGLAYYGLFALVPLLTLAGGLAGAVFSTATVQDALAEPLARLLGPEYRGAAAELADLTTSGATTQLGLVGLGALPAASSLVFVAFQDALNVIWGVPVQPGVRQTVRRRVVSFGVALTTGGILTVSLAVQAVLGIVGGLLPVEGGVVLAVTNVASGLVPLVVTAAALALLFARLPRADVDRRAAVAAGLATAVLMVLCVVLAGLYLRRFATVSVSGAMGGVLLILVLIYVESQIVLAGAELTKVLTRRWRVRAAMPANTGHDRH